MFGCSLFSLYIIDQLFFVYTLSSSFCKLRPICTKQKSTRREGTQCVMCTVYFDEEVSLTALTCWDVYVLRKNLQVPLQLNGFFKKEKATKPDTIISEAPRAKQSMRTKNSRVTPTKQQPGRRARVPPVSPQSKKRTNPRLLPRPHLRPPLAHAHLPSCGCPG